MKKIQTIDCVNAIIEHFKHAGGHFGISNNSPILDPKQWKRRSKSGSGKITRTFENIKTGDVISVEATDEIILSVTSKFGTEIWGHSSLNVPEPKIKKFNDFKGKKYRFAITNYNGAISIIVFPMNLNASEVEVNINSSGVEDVMNKLGIDAESEDNTFDYFGNMNKTEIKNYLISCGWKEDKKLMN